MLLRKIERELEALFKCNDRYALLISGARQVGKTFIIRETAKRHFKNIIEINFIKNPKAKNLFTDTTSEKDFFILLSAIADKPLVPGETLIFFDEVQKCKEVVTFIKFLVDDGRFKYVLSGSLLGIELNDLRSAPVGYLREIEMFPLDFEEFISANGFSAEALGLVKNKCHEGGEVPSVIHDTLMKLFKLYLVVGGMPAAVQTYVDSSNISDVLQIQKAIVIEYKKDASKYDEENKMKIVRTLELIPSELNRENKRFYASDLKKHEKFNRLEDNFLWLAKAGIAIPVYSVDSPKPPLELAKKANLFKLFTNDVGLVASQYAAGIQLEILSGNIEINFGAIYENYVAQELRAHGNSKIYYFNSKKHGEVDFLIETAKGVSPIEVKSGKDFRKHQALNNMLNVDEYNLKGASVLCSSPSVELNTISYYPIYATMFIANNTLPPDLIYKI